jgi:hypothetical protein
MIKNLFIVFSLTVLIGVLSGFITSPEFYSQSGAIFLTIIVTSIFYALPNTILLFLLQRAKIVQAPLQSLRFIITEVCVLFIMVIVVHKLIPLVPFSDRFEVTPTSTSIKPYYGEGAKIIYAFVLTLLIMVPLARLTKLFETKPPAATL